VTGLSELLPGRDADHLVLRCPSCGRTRAVGLGDVFRFLAAR
jgi:hypothetical protein